MDKELKSEPTWPPAAELAEIQAKLQRERHAMEELYRRLMEKILLLRGENSRLLNGMEHCTEQVEEQCSNGSFTSYNPLKVTILGSTLALSRLDSIAFSQALAIQLAKLPNVKVTLLVPENSYISSFFKRQAVIGVSIVEAQKIPGFDDPDDWLYFPPQDLKTDVVVGAGARLGKVAQVFKDLFQCKSIYISSDHLEKHAVLLEKRRILDKQIALHAERNHYDNVGLSQMADLAVALGPKMYEELYRCQKDVFKFTPGILSNFSDVTQATNEEKNFRILMLGGGDPDNFEQEGLNTAAEAVAELKNKSYHLFYVGAAEGKHEQFAKKICQFGVSRSQLTIRSFPENEEEWKRLFCEVDLAIMPSSELGFGMEALAALSSGLPVLVHEDSGFGVALKKVNFGTSSTVESEDAIAWAKEIKKVRKTERKTRLKQAALLRSNYDKMYSWEKQCGALVQKMLTMVSVSYGNPIGSLGEQEMLWEYSLKRITNLRQSSKEQMLLLQDSHHGVKKGFALCTQT